MPPDDLGRDVPLVDAASADDADAAVEPSRRRLRWWQEAVVILAIGVVIAVVVKTLLVQAFYIPSESMEPGLQVDDKILVEKPSYWTGGPQRGDVVVFADPGGWLGSGEVAAAETGPLRDALTRIGLIPTGGHLVKRVVGVPGDVIECCDERGRISINGEALTEKGYAQRDQAACFGPMTGTCSWSAGPVPEGKVFVLGDNRAHSGDSSAQLCTAAETDCVPGREYVDDDLIVGKVAAVFWPWSHVRRLARPAALADVPAAS